MVLCTLDAVHGRNGKMCFAQLMAFRGGLFGIIVPAMSSGTVFFKHFAKKICKTWGLHDCIEEVPREDGRAIPAAPTHRSLHTLDNIPLAHGGHCPQIQWERDMGSFSFVVDCRPLAQIMNGQAPLKTPTLAPIFERMTQNIFELLGAGWTPECQVADPVLWQRREHNEIANHIVNAAMDAKADWYKRFDPPFVDFKINEANFICHSDGGTRGELCSAIGWIVECIVFRNGTFHQFPYAIAGTFLKDPVSSFLAEAMALDDGIRFMVKELV